MTSRTAEIETLAQRLVALEAALDGSADAQASASVRVIENLRKHLIKLTGIHGFRSLLSRALTLAKEEVPSLNSVQVSANGSLQGLEGIDHSPKNGAAEQAGIVLVAHLVELLVTFIGAPLTLRLLREEWPDASLGKAASGIEDKP